MIERDYVSVLNNAPAVAADQVLGTSWDPLTWHTIQEAEELMRRGALYNPFAVDDLIIDRGRILPQQSIRRTP